MELYTLKINVTNQRLSFGENPPEIYSGDQSIDFVEFTFTDDTWNFPDIWAIFYRQKGAAYQIALDDNKVMIPAEVMQKRGYVYIGLMATDGENVQTSSVLQYSIRQGAANVETVTPSPSIYEQFLNDLEAYQEAIHNLQTLAATAETLPAGSDATASYNNGVLELGIPKGDTGATGNGIQSIAKTSTSGSVDTYTITYTNGSTTTYNVTNGEVTQAQFDNLKRETSVLNNVVERSVFNGLNSVCSIDSITLSQDGDELEIEVFPEVATDAYGYSFASNNNKINISIGATTKGVAFRAVDQTWLYLGNTVFQSDKYHYVIKISYANGNILFYVDNILLSTYTGQKNMKIDGFGMNNYWQPWKGQVGYIKYNGIKYSTISSLSNFYGSNVTRLLPYGFLSEQQNNLLIESSDKLFISTLSNKVSVYFNLSGDNFGRIDIGHESNHSDNQFVDYWRINDSAVCTSTNGETFVPTAKKLLVGAENEMAINFTGMSDFTGGYHGDERIDLDPDCYVIFIVDGEELTITDLVSLGNIKCDEFGYREVSKLYASYTYNPNHLPIANHVKETIFSGKELKTTNYVEMDLSSFDQSSLNVITAFTGLYCIGQAFADVAISDTGEEYLASHPVSTVTLAENMNKYSLRAKTLKDNYSCVMDSRLIKTNISEYENPPIDVDIWDRQTDLKYYSFLPLNVVVHTGDFLATEGWIKWAIS